MVRIMLLDLLVEPRTFGLPGILEFLRPFAKLGDVECLLISPQVQKSFPDSPSMKTADRGDFGFWHEEVEFFAQKILPLAGNSVNFRRIITPDSSHFSEWFDNCQIDAFLATGSPRNLSSPEPWMATAQDLFVGLYERECPTLGICFGHQLLSLALGGSLERADHFSNGVWDVKLTEMGREDELFRGVENPVGVFTHQDHIVKISRQLVHLATAKETQFAAVRACRDGQLLPLWGTQFHCEATAELFDRNLRLGWMNSEVRRIFRGNHSGAIILQNFADFVNRVL